MFDARTILDTLSREARAAAAEFDLDQKADQAKAAAQKVRERIETDPQARNAAIGVGGLLLAGLLGTSGGRRLTGDIAKTGAVAALGALAYRAWVNRQQGDAPGAAPPDQTPAALGHFPAETGENVSFNEAVVLAMVGAAGADGALDPEEKAVIARAMARAGLDEALADAIMADGLDAGGQEARILDAIAAGAITPNHAAELYAAAVIAAGEESAAETAFLKRLAERLGISPAYAASIRAEAYAEG